EIETLIPRYGRKRLDAATHAVATGLGGRAVGIEDGDEVLRSSRARVVDRHDLVEPRRRIGVERDRCLGRHAIGATAHVGNDDLVAEAVHPGKGRALAHAALYGGNQRELPVSPAALRAASQPVRQWR